MAGKKYHVGYYVSLADSHIVACNYMGIHFSDTVPTFNNIGTYPVPPLNASVEFHQDLTNKTDWTKLDTVYIANGTERFITVGNMRDNTQCHGIYVGGNSSCTGSYCWDVAVYLVDDVFVELLDETGISPTNLTQREAFKLVPNPSNGSFVIQCPANNAVICTIQNISGQEVYNKTIQTQNMQAKIDDAILAKGIYILKIADKNGVQCMKLVVE